VPCSIGEPGKASPMRGRGFRARRMRRPTVAVAAVEHLICGTVPEREQADMLTAPEERQYLEEAVTRSVLLKRPQRHGAADDGCDRQWSEVAAVE
jgi:hypothetical protein